MPYKTCPVAAGFPTSKQLLRFPSQSVDILLLVINLVAVEPDRTALGIEGSYRAQHVTKVANDNDFASIRIELPDYARYLIRYVFFCEVQGEFLLANIGDLTITILDTSLTEHCDPVYKLRIKPFSVLYFLGLPAVAAQTAERFVPKRFRLPEGVSQKLHPVFSRTGFVGMNAQGYDGWMF